ncbi:hypothetical protein GCM10022393_27780 [Aquimarina addita]|uniref:Serine protease n=1 Tax=Aquimarina addita TaxID=870485 RepID=A0ABP6UNH2_9FLAO
MKYLDTNQSYSFIGYRFQKLVLFLIFLTLLSPFIGNAQDELERHYVKYDLVFQSEDNKLNTKSAEIISEKISEKNAEWLRLFFTDINLGEQSTLTITSTLDGHSQTLTGETIKNWQNSSAYFNGDEVTVSLQVVNDEKNVGFTIHKVGVGERAQQTKSQCGSTDDRVSSNDAAIGRIVPIGCTGWIIRNGKLVTAGHCADASRATIIEFNVPPSNSDRSIVHPGPEDQYPIGNFITPYAGTSITDWAVFTASSNSETGQTPIQAQRKSYNVTQATPGSTIRITGYGVDSGSDNQTQQTHTGPMTSTNSNYVYYQTDTEGGNSGSPIIDEATGNAVGVHAYGGCRSINGSNFGERATISAFWDAMDLDNPGTTTNLVQIVKRNASGYALDGNNGGADGQNLYLWSSDPGNVNQQWIEIDQGGGYYSYIKNGTNYAIDGGNGGSLRQNVYLWTYNANNYNQHWRKVNAGGGYVKLEKRNSSGFSINGGSNGANGQNVNLYTSSNPSQNLQWQIIPLSESADNSESVAGEIESINEEEVLAQNAVFIYPNPSDQVFSIKVGKEFDNAVATIYSYLGKKHGEIYLKEGDNEVKTSQFSLSSGMYLLRVNSQGAITTHNVIIK